MADDLRSHMPGKERVDSYLNTIDRLEPDIAMIDPGAYYASAAISLKRIADVLEVMHKRRELTNLADAINALEMTVRGINNGR